jgi:hypothetical protein
MSKIIGAVIICLDQSYTQREDIGLYTSGSDDSEIRWSESPLAGFCHTMLLKGGIGAVSESFDETNGGNVTTVGDFTFSIHGAMQFLLRMNSLSIQLSGKLVEYVEYVDGTPEVVGSFTIEDTTANEFEERITAKTAFQLRRNSLLATRLSVTEYPDVTSELKDATIPVAFGQSDPENGVFFKLPRIEYRNTEVATSEIDPGSSWRPTGMTLFPVRNVSVDSAHLEVIFGSGIGPAATLTTLLGKYVKIMSGSVDADGEIRRISTAPQSQADGDYRVDKWTELTLLQYFSEILPGISGETYGTFVSIIDVLLRYALDGVICGGFGVGVRDLYVMEDVSMVRVADVGVTTNATLPIYDVEPFKSIGEIGSTSSFKVIPITGIEPLEARDYDNVVINNLDRFGITGYIHATDGDSAHVPGVFIALESGNLCEDGMSATDEEDAFDRTYSTYALFATYITKTYPTQHFNYYIALRLTLPEIDDTVVFDKVYLGLAIWSICEDDSTDPTLDIDSRFIVARRKYYGNSENPVDNTDILFTNQVEFKSLPNGYYNGLSDTGNKNFYYAESSATALTGYKNYDLEIASRAEYNNIEEMVLLFKRQGVQTVGSYIDDTIRVHEAAVIFEKTITIGSEIYA